MAFPHPLAIWTLALVALSLGLRDRRARRRPVSTAIPSLVIALARIPAPAGLVERGRRERIAGAAVAAGLPRQGTVDLVARARAGGATAGVAAALALAPLSPVLAVFGLLWAVAGFVLPLVWVEKVARGRRRRIVRELPDVIDMVVLSIQAGVALEPALRLAVARMPGPLSEEFALTLRQLDLGTPRREAYSLLARRMGVPELTSLVGALLQADELGTPIASAIGRQAELLRAARRQAIRDAAVTTAPKVQLVVAMVMVPSALLVVLGVLVINLFGQIGGVVGGGS